MLHAPGSRLYVPGPLTPWPRDTLAPLGTLLNHMLHAPSPMSLAPWPPVWPMLQVHAPYHIAKTCAQDDALQAEYDLGDALWHARSSEAQTKLGLVEGAHVGRWTETHVCRGLPTTARYRDYIDLFWAHACNTREGSRRDVVKDLFCNPTQCTTRIAQRAPPPHPPTLARNSIIYSYENDTVLSAAAQMRFHGWPFGWTPLEFSESGLRSLSGDCYSVPWATAMQLALWLNPHAVWWQ